MNQGGMSSTYLLSMKVDLAQTVQLFQPARFTPAPQDCVVAAPIEVHLAHRGSDPMDDLGAQVDPFPVFRRAEADIVRQMLSSFLICAGT